MNLTVNGGTNVLRRLGQGKRGVEDSVCYSLANRLRIEIRAALHEGPATAAQLAGIVDEPRESVDYALKEMLKDGSVDIAKIEKVGNLDQRYYSVVALPYFSDADFDAMSLEERQTLCAITVQAATTEAMASLLAGKMANDPRVVLAWNRINLDQQGRAELADEEARSWRRKHEIEAESTNRRAKAGGPGVSYVIASFSYERSRTSAPDPVVPPSTFSARNFDVDSAPVGTTHDVRPALGSKQRAAVLQHWQKAKRGVEDSVCYSLAKRVRIEIRAALHEGPATASQLAEMVQASLSNIDYHLKAMLKDGSIEIAKIERLGNLDQRYYSVITLPYFSDADFDAMSPEERQTLCAIAVQAAGAEAMASLWTGKMANDPRLVLAWNRINLDQQGRAELADEEAQSWCRKCEIEAESANRRAKTGDPGVSYVVTALSFERSRTSAPEPLSKDHPPPGKY